MNVENLAKELILKNMTQEQQMAVLDSVRKSVAQAKEVQKKKIGENVDLVVQALKKIESDIRSRFDDVGNTIEKRVASIKDGRDGQNGSDGRDGKDGKAGRDGATGPRGADGLNGKDGRDGEDGVSVIDAHIDFDGSLIISLSSGRLINVGEVVAQDLAEKIKVITNGGGTSQSVLDTLASLQAQIDEISIPSQTGNSGKYLTTNGTDLSWGTVTGVINYQGTWNATTNTPTLTSSVGTSGYYYVVATAGSTNLNGITDWQIGDWLIFNGSVWQKIDQTNLVMSVNGYTGAVVLTQTDISGTASLTTTQTLTNKTLTSPIINEILDSNGNEILGLSTTTSATDFLTVKNGIGVGVPLHIYADGSSTNVGLHIQPKGSGLVTISDGTDFNKGIRFRSSSSAASAITLLDAVATSGRVVTLPDATTTLVGRDTTDTLTNKTLTSPTLTTPILGTPTSGNFSSGTFTWPTFNQNTTGNAATATNVAYSGLTGTIPTWNQNTTGTASNVTGTVAIANGGTGETTRQAAMDALAGAVTSGSYLRGNGTDVVMNTIQVADVPTLNQNTTGTAASTPKLLTTNFTIEESGGKLLFKYGATTIASMSSTGVITSATNIVSNGTP